MILADCAERLDAQQGFLGDRRLGRLVRLEQLAAGMSPTRCMLDAGRPTEFGLIQRAVAGKRVGMHDAAEPGEVAALVARLDGRTSSSSAAAGGADPARPLVDRTNQNGGSLVLPVPSARV